MPINALLPAPTTNLLLTALPLRDRKHILECCDSVDLVFADVLVEKGAPISHVYFPVQGFISLVAKIDGDARIEVGLVGNEGMLGTSLILGVGIAPMQALVQGDGSALRMKAATFRHELEQLPPLQRVLKRYLHVLMEQLAQTTACNRFHVVEARLARWLLMTQDRAHCDDFHVTHEFLSIMLGVRRVGITKAAGSLQREGLIRYHRGMVTIINRAGLEAASCSCYEMDRAAYKRAMQ